MATLTEIQQAEAALQKLDPELGALIELQKPIVHVPRSDYFFSLCRSIVGQQVSVAAATTIFGRLEAATKIDPKKIIAIPEDELKGVGLSRQKAGYIRDMAQHFVDNPTIYNHLDELSDEQIIEDLTAIKGVGVWTAQMFLMFTLTRLDVFAPADVGLQRGIKLLYNLPEVPPAKELEAMAEAWRPYRTVASWHLWKSLDNTPD